MWSKQRPEGADRIIAASEALSRLSHPHAETVHPGQVWRVHGRGTSTIGWVRYEQPPTGPARWHLYYDHLNADGNRVWCHTFQTFTSAVAYAVQHAGEMKRGPTRG